MQVPQDPIGHRRPSPSLGMAYTNRIPSAPPIQLPLPVMEQQVQYAGVPLPPLYRDPSSQEDLIFLDDNVMHRVVGVGVGTWQYEHRRDVQSVLPFLYISPVSALRDVEALKRFGITLIIGLAPTSFGAQFISVPARRAAEQLGIPYHLVTADSSAQLISSYKMTSLLINRHLMAMKHQRGGIFTWDNPAGKVLIFCDSGNSRSATLAAAYIMETFQDTDYMNAMRILMSVRFCCDFEDGYRQSLLNWNGMINARRQIAPLLAAQQQSVHVPASGTKRGFHRDDDDDDAMVEDLADDAERFQDRLFSTPFNPLE